MERIGFYPAGGGVIFAEIQPLARADAKPLVLLERGNPGHHYAIIRRAHLAANICDREWDAMRRVLLWDSSQRRDFAHDESAGPGNAVQKTSAGRLGNTQIRLRGAVETYSDKH